MPELLTGRGGHVLKVVATAMGVRELVYTNAEADELSSKRSRVSLVDFEVAGRAMGEAKKLASDFSLFLLDPGASLARALHLLLLHLLSRWLTHRVRPQGAANGSSSS